MQQLSLTQMLDMVDEPNGSRLRRLYCDNSQIIENARGSKSKHQAWRGGYVGHLEEMGTMGINMYMMFTNDWNRKFPFTISDVMSVILIHDLEKPWKHYSENGSWKSAPALVGDSAHKFVDDILDKYGVRLSDSQKKAMIYVHGENEKYDPNINMTNKLGAFCHSLDYLSARLFHNYPKERPK